MGILAAGRFDSILILLVSFALFYFFMQQSKGGAKFKVRTFPAVTAIPEAVGRAAEMGKPIYYSTGLGMSTLNNQLNGPQTLAGISILSMVTRLCARSGVRIAYFTPIADSIPLVEETMKTSYMTEGKPDEFNTTEQIFFQADQSSYLTASLGWIQRERPASCFLIGGYYYESVVLGEAGNTIGAMQISGTANSAQLPFLVATTDYTLIMEELYAASAEISENPDVLGSLRGEDILKFVTLALLIIGFVIAFAGSTFVINLLSW
jgi:hypothetical protein